MTHTATNSTQRTPTLQLKFDPEDVLPRDRVLDLLENSGPGRKLAAQERILRACHLSPPPRPGLPKSRTLCGGC